MLSNKAKQVNVKIIDKFEDYEEDNEPNYKSKTEYLSIYCHSFKKFKISPLILKKLFNIFNNIKSLSNFGEPFNFE